MPTPQLPDLPPGPSLDRVRGPVEIPPFETWEIVGMSTAGIVLVSIVLWGILTLIRRQRSKIAPIDPKTAALEEIKAAAQLSGEDDGRFAQLTVTALRRFYQNSLGIQTLGQTTREFIVKLDASPTDRAEADGLLKELMRQCDQIKFAQKQLTVPERENLSETATRIIRLCDERKETSQS